MRFEGRPFSADAFCILTSTIFAYQALLSSGPFENWLKNSHFQSKFKFDFYAHDGTQSNNWWCQKVHLIYWIIFSNGKRLPDAVQVCPRPQKLTDAQGGPCALLLLQKSAFLYILNDDTNWISMAKSLQNQPNFPNIFPTASHSFLANMETIGNFLVVVVHTTRKLSIRVVLFIKRKPS